MANWWVVGTGLLVVIGTGAACASQADSTTRSLLRLNESTKVRLAEALRDLPDVTTRVIAGEGSSAALQALQDNRADIGIVMADVAYRAYAEPAGGTSKRFDALRGIAVLNVNIIYLAVNPRAGIQSITDLRGRHVAIGSAGTATARIAQLLLEASGLPVSQLKAEILPYRQAVTQLTTGELDAAFLALNSSVQAATNNGAKLVDVWGLWLEPLRQLYPFLQATLVPAGTFAGRDRALHTVGIDLLLVCRADLDKELVYRIIKSYFDDLQEREPATDLERAPATPIPLHPGAARYYRERTLSR